MKKSPLILFGNNTFSSLAWYCLTQDSSYEVVAFTVDRAFMRSDVHEGLPVVPFEDMEQSHPPGDVSLLLSIGYHAINGLRRARYTQAKAMGYKFASYVSSRASVWPDLQLGENCLIYEGAVIQPFARIGDNAIIRSRAHISHHCTVADHAFIAAGATLGGNATVGEQTFVGLGAVVRDGIALAERSFIGTGAVVIAATEADGVYVGNPARKSERSSLQVSGG